jgi:hypothetical protein
VIQEQSSSAQGAIQTPKLIKGFKDMFAKGMWGQQLLTHFLQEQADWWTAFSFSPCSACSLIASPLSITLIESIEDYALKEVGQKSIYPTFRFLLQIVYDAGRLALLAARLIH